MTFSRGCVVCLLEPFPAVSGQRHGTPMDKLPAHCRALRSNLGFQSLADLLYPLSYSCPLQQVRPVSKKHSSTAILKTFSTASGALLMAFLLHAPVMSRRLYALHNDFPAKPLPPMSVGKHLTCHPHLQHSSTCSAYPSLFLSLASSINSSQGTVSSSMINCFDFSAQHSTMSNGPQNSFGDFELSSQVHLQIKNCSKNACLVFWFLNWRLSCSHECDMVPGWLVALQMESAITFRTWWCRQQ